jgi:hypothetical protein
VRARSQNQFTSVKTAGLLLPIDLLALAETVLGRADKLRKKAQKRGADVETLAGDRELAVFIERTRHVCDTAHRRVILGEEVPNCGKLFSVFETHTQLYQRGKTAEPVQFGRQVLVYEDAAGFLLDCHVLPREKNVNRQNSAKRGRRGLDYWPILVLAAVRLRCNLDYDALQDLAENHAKLRQIMGVGGWDGQPSFDWRRIRDNLCLLRPETIQRISRAIVAECEGGVRVPLIVRWPGAVPPGSKCCEMITGVDFYPTLLEIAGLQGDPRHQAEVDGVSVVPLLKQIGVPTRDAIFWHYPHYDPIGGYPYGAIRQGDARTGGVPSRKAARVAY